MPARFSNRSREKLRRSRRSKRELTRSLRKQKMPLKKKERRQEKIERKSLKILTTPDWSMNYTEPSKALTKQHSKNSRIPSTTLLRNTTRTPTPSEPLWNKKPLTVPKQTLPQLPRIELTMKRLMLKQSRVNSMPIMPRFKSKRILRRLSEMTRMRRRNC